MKRITWLISFILFFLSLTLFPFIHPVYAEDKYQSNVVVIYAIQESGITHVTTNIVITNTTPNFYVSSYTLKLGFAHIDNVKSYDSSGPIIPVITNTDTGQDVTLKLNETIYGQNSKVSFTLSYDTPDIATKNGSIWEVNIPGLASQNEFSDFTVQVQVPQSFGKATYIKPEQLNDSLTFTKNQLGKSGISLAFGKNQTYSFHLLYHLQNPNLFSSHAQIALPPSTNYQDVFITSLNPKPVNVTQDSDGNWIADYLLAPSQNIIVTADGAVAVNLYPKQSTISAKERTLYTEDKQYWQQSPAIKDLASKLKTPEAIYQYVVGHLHYDFSRVKNSQQRLGADTVLNNPSSAVCLEFSDLFVAIARSAGIPAREVDGYAYTQNTKERPLSLITDVLHAWPEYYDDSKKAWVMVDPTWGNTTGGVDYFHTFDFDHIAFTIKGESSTAPIPAGGYKLTGEEGKRDITVTFGALPQDTTPRIQASLVMEDKFMSLFPVSGSLILKNSGVSLFPTQEAIIKAERLTPSSQQAAIPDIPPFGTITVPIHFDKTGLLTNTHTAITIALAGEEISKKITVLPVTPSQLALGGIILAIFSFTLFIIATKSRRVQTP